MFLGWNPSYSKDRMREKKSANQISVIKNLQRKHENLKESKQFRDLILILAEYKNGKICKIFKMSLTAAELEQIFYIKGFVMKEAKYCFI